MRPRVQSPDPTLTPPPPKKKPHKLCVVVHTCNPSTGRADTSGFLQLAEWGKPRESERLCWVSSALSFHMSPLTVPPCLGMKGPSCAMTAAKRVQSPLAVPEVMVLSNHLLLASLFSCTSCCCQVCSFIGSPSLPADFRGTCWGGMLSPALALKSSAEAR